MQVEEDEQTYSVLWNGNISIATLFMYIHIVSQFQDGINDI